mmetsp:Transcript_85110/g.133002  ORF Transcript_85110/g.133002 Transcript_85110/m.133002 type:complete len:201 (-) Transcript_85110:19-621(-)
MQGANHTNLVNTCRQENTKAWILASMHHLSYSVRIQSGNISTPDDEIFIESHPNEIIREDFCAEFLRESALITVQIYNQQFHLILGFSQTLNESTIVKLGQLVLLPVLCSQNSIEGYGSLRRVHAAGKEEAQEPYDCCANLPYAMHESPNQTNATYAITRSGNASCNKSFWSRRIIHSFILIQKRCSDLATMRFVACSPM